ncbi:MAG: hypothetical protein F6K04_02460 [Leptolyngbya sp. SIO4C5]|nr:hypothetical protein [Leptolyngbya sp. SIO4C5]
MADNPMRKLMDSRKKSAATGETELETGTDEILKQPAEPPQSSPEPQKRKRGRPATGKRSDPGWIGRTYYVKEETDIDTELELAMLRRQGVEMDKSELVNSLLDAWVKWRKGKDSEKLLGEISPRRKDD